MTIPQKLSDGLVTAGDIVLPRNGLMLPKVKRIRMAAKTTGEKATLFKLPTKGIVLGVWVDVRTAEVTAGTKTVDVGLLSSEAGGDADGFAVGVPTTPTGVKRPGPVITVGGTETFFASTTRGALLCPSFLAGANVAGDVGTIYEAPHTLNGTARTVSYTLGSAHTEVVFDIYVAFVDFTA